MANHKPYLPRSLFCRQPRESRWHRRWLDREPKPVIPLTERQQAEVERYLPTVAIAVRNRPSIFDELEATQIASAALCEHIDGWEDGHGKSKKNYLIDRMKWALLDEARRVLRGRKGRKITQLVSWDALPREEREVQEFHSRAGSHEEPCDCRDAVRTAYDSLDPKSQLVIAWVVAGRPWSEIGRELGLTERRIEQFVPEILQILREKLERMGVKE